MSDVPFGIIRKNLTFIPEAWHDGRASRALDEIGMIDHRHLVEFIRRITIPTPLVVKLIKDGWLFNEFSVERQTILDEYHGVLGK